MPCSGRICSLSRRRLRVGLTADVFRTTVLVGSRHAILVVHIHSDQEQTLEFLQQSLRCSLGPVLGSDQRSPRRVDKLQISSWDLGPPRGSDPRVLADHLFGPWHIICIQEGAVFVTNNASAETLLCHRPTLFCRSLQQ